jgi:ribosomal protein L24
MTCEAHYKKCNQPQKEAVLKDEKGNPQFNMVVCLTCWGVVESTRINQLKEEKKPKTAAKALAAKAAVATEEVEPAVVQLTESTVVADVAPVVKERPSPDFSIKPVGQKSEDLEPVKEYPLDMGNYITLLELNNTTVVDIIIKLKETFSLSNTEAARILKQRRADLKVSVSAPVEVKAEPVVQVNEVVKEVVKEAVVVAKTIPAPLPEKEAKQAAESPIKPSNVTTIAQRQDLFPVTGFELDFENKSYRFKLASPDGEEFEFAVVPDPAKFEIVTKNPSVFNEKSLLIQYDKVDSSELPVEGKLIGMQ